MTEKRNIKDFISKDEFSEISPHIGKKNITIPYYGPHSEILLALKDVTIRNKSVGIAENSPYPNEEISVERMAKIFRKKADEEDKIYAAYNLSHELKIANIVVNLAIEGPESNVFEIGSASGFGALYYANKAFNKIPADKPAYHLRAFEICDHCIGRANWLKEIMKNIRHIAEISYILGDGINGVRKLGSDGDIAFSSITEPEILEGILEISKEKKIKSVLSYSDEAEKEFKKRSGRSSFDSSFDCVYEVFPFEDKAYGANVNDANRRFGVLVIPKADIIKPL